MTVQPSHRQTGLPLTLTGTDGNAFAILGSATRVLRRAGIDPKQFTEEATSGDYDHLLATCFRYFDVA